MDDFNSNVLSEAKNEYSSRLVTILTPLIIEGIKSIFKEAYDLCNKNDENNKYLMTFQNFLTRIPRWNQQIINDETKRIIQRSGCSYLEDILTCVHITQLKILTSIRVSSHQKKVNIDIPKLPDFVHKIYIESARKIYENVYLFEANIAPLQQQKNMRECEIICQESILNVVRASMPIEQILRAYIDETEEEEVVQEVVKTPAPSEKLEKIDETKSSETDLSSNILSDMKTSSIKKNTLFSNVEVDSKTEKNLQVKELIKDIVESKPSVPDVESNKDKIKTMNPVIENKTDTIVPSESLASKAVSKIADFKIDTETSPSAPSEISKPKGTKLSFNNSDNIMKYKDTDTVTQIKAQDSKQLSAPKTLERLEAISQLRHEQRKIENEAEVDADNDDGETLTIHKDAPSVKLDALDIQVLDTDLQLKTAPILTGVETI